MRKTTVLIVGIGGYGGWYLQEILSTPRGQRLQIVGAVDPYAKQSERAEILQEKGIPIFDTLEEFYEGNSAQMAIVATPTYLHASQAQYCMERGSDVLCEKPLCATRAEAQALIDARNRTGRKLAVGFQWSFSEAVLRLKEDIIGGVYGKLRRFRTIVYFPRSLDYYQRKTGWGGRRRLPTGEWLFDSVASNGASHYLHNMLFLTGSRMDRSARPMDMLAEVYRANPIEMFDTCALRIHTEENVELLFYATHAVPKEQERRPEFVLEGEQGIVTLENVDGQERMRGVLSEGTVIPYNGPSADIWRKLFRMEEAIRHQAPLTCVLETTLPHLDCIEALAESFPETPMFPPEFICYSEEERQYTCRGLVEDLDRCWRAGTLPSEEKLPWAQGAHEINFDV